MSTSKIVIALVVLSTILALILFIPYNFGGNNPDKFKDSEYYEIIKGIDELLVNDARKQPQNNFEMIVEMVKGWFEKDSETAYKRYLYLGHEQERDTNYIELAEDRTPGVDSPRKVVSNSDYIFRVEKKTDGKYSYERVIRAYSIAGENTAMLFEYDMPEVKNGSTLSPLGMLLSDDGKTLTIVGEYYIRNNSYTAVVAIDVTNPQSVTEKGRFLVDGELASARMSDGKIVLVSRCGFSTYDIDYSKPSTFVPRIDTGNGYECMKPEDISYPDGIGYGYAVFSIFDASSFELTTNKALMGVSFSDVYIYEDNIYLARRRVAEEIYADTAHYSYLTDVNVINYSSGKIERTAILTVRGVIEESYGFDERDGYLRIVTSTLEGYSTNHGETSSYRESINVSIYVFNLADNSLVYKNEDFAVEGDRAFKVRFMGDNLYICTDAVRSVDTHVYAFELGDYSNVIRNDAGATIENTIALREIDEGLFVCVRTKGSTNCCVTVYRKDDYLLEVVDEYSFVGSFGEPYTFMINTDENLIGFCAHITNGQYKPNSEYYHVLLGFDGENLVELDKYEIAREVYLEGALMPVYYDGYLYLTTQNGTITRKITR